MNEQQRKEFEKGFYHASRKNVIPQAEPSDFYIKGFSLGIDRNISREQRRSGQGI